MIGKDSGNWFSTFTIDKGSNDGIKVDHECSGRKWTGRDRDSDRSDLGNGTLRLLMIPAT